MDIFERTNNLLKYKCVSCEKEVICHALYFDALDALKRDDYFKFVTYTKIEECKSCEEFENFEKYIEELEGE